MLLYDYNRHRFRPCMVCKAEWYLVHILIYLRIDHNQTKLKVLKDVANQLYEMRYFNFFCHVVSMFRNYLYELDS